MGRFEFFRKLMENRGDIHSSRCTTGVVDTCGKRKKSLIRKVLNLTFGHLWLVELTYREKFFLQVNFKV
jgi:hypothetical protein